MPSTVTQRRNFLKKLTALAAAASFTPSVLSTIPSAKPVDNKEGDGFTFLFQGDSITNGDRTRINDWNHVMGHGYQYIIACKLWYEFQIRVPFFNRGISGIKITDLAARWDKDIIELKPDLLSILFGIYILLTVFRAWFATQQ